MVWRRKKSYSKTKMETKDRNDWRGLNLPWRTFHFRQNSTNAGNPVKLRQLRLEGVTPLVSATTLLLLITTTPLKNMSPFTFHSVRYNAGATFETKWVPFALPSTRYSCKSYMSRLYSISVTMGQRRAPGLHLRSHYDICPVGWTASMILWTA